MLERFERLDRLESQLASGMGQALAALAALRGAVDECRTEIDTLRHQSGNGHLAAMTDEMASLRNEVHALKRSKLVAH